MSRSERISSALTLARYRSLILLGKAVVPLEEARRIVGPDCAYHLYFRHAHERPAAKATGPCRRARRRHK